MSSKTLEVVLTSLHRNVKSNLSTYVQGEEQSTASDGNPFLVEHLSSLLGNDTTTPCTKNNITPNCKDIQKADISDFDDYKMATLLWQVCPPILFFFGTAGNLLIFLMLRQLRIGRSSMHIYLRVLGITDLVVLYTGLLRWWILYTFNLDIRLIHVSVCKIHVWLVFVSLSVSAWLLVLMTLERTFSVCIPHRVNMFCTKRRALGTIIFIIIFNGCFYSHFLIGVTIINDNDTLICTAHFTETYNYFLYEIWPFVDLFILSVLPSSCLIVCNIIIVYKTFISLKSAADLNLTSGTNSLRRRNAVWMTAILLVLSIFFLLTTSPTCVYNMWQRGMAARDVMETPQGEAKLELIWAAVNILMYCNNSFNFYLYCLTGTKFRREMQRQLSRNRSNSTESRSVKVSAPSVHRFKKISLREVKKSGMVEESGAMSLTTPFGTPKRSPKRMHDSNAYS